MISRLQNANTNFKAQSPALKNAIEGNTGQKSEISTQEAQKEKFSITKTYSKAKKSAINFFKGMNNVTGVAGGIARGVAEGVVATTVVAIGAKALKEAENFNVFQIVGNAVTDVAKGACNVIKFIPSLITKAPIDNLKTIGSLPKKLYTNYLKNYKGAATLATVAGLSVLALRTIQGKVNANNKNADLDHATNQGHV
ncbi:MAG: hypothetical protein IKU37_03710 [Candidatus Gastranaerophilales bacterium]|nr:hypothetical protein [Candidatus Gastranaerophilales bacterium]